MKLEVWGEPELDVAALAKSGEVIGAAEVVKWFREAGKGPRLPIPSEDSDGVRAFVDDLNRIRVSKDVTSALTRSDGELFSDQQRLQRVKDAISALKNDLPFLIEALIEQKGSVGIEVREDNELGPLLRLYESASARLPLRLESRLPSHFGYDGHRRAQWHPVAALMAERAIAIWGNLTRRTLGIGKPTSPAVLFVASALERVGEGKHGGQTIIKALARMPKGDNSKSI